MSGAADDTLKFIHEEHRTPLVMGTRPLLEALAAHDWREPVKLGYTTEGERLVTVRVGDVGYGLELDEAEHLSHLGETVLATEGAGDGEDVVGSFLLALRDATRRAREAAR